MAKPGPDPMISQDEVLAAMQKHDEPFITSKDLARRHEVTEQTAYKYLRRLYSSGRIERKKVGGSAVIWWLDGRCD